MEPLSVCSPVTDFLLRYCLGLSAALCPVSFSFLLLSSRPLLVCSRWRTPGVFPRGHQYRCSCCERPGARHWVCSFLSTTTWFLLGLYLGKSCKGRWMCLGRYCQTVLSKQRPRPALPRAMCEGTRRLSPHQHSLLSGVFCSVGGAVSLCLGLTFPETGDL